MSCDVYRQLDLVVKTKKNHITFKNDQVQLQK